MDTKTAEQQYYMKQLSVTSGDTETLKRTYYNSINTVQKDNGQDAFVQFLTEEGYSGHYLDMFKSYLESEGYSGNLTDIENQFYNDNI